MMLSAKKQFTDFIENQQLFTSKDTILLAVSGGKDSVLMAHLFALCGYKFAIAHCNFQLRGEESVRDQSFVESLAKALDAPIYIKQFNTLAYADENKISVQMAARDLRYQYFEELRVSEGFNKVAVAHHQNDATETVLINLIRGTGIRGLHGIKANRDAIVRPMLCFTSIEIEEIVKSEKINYVEDSSNASTKYMRNKVRLDIVPKMKELNPTLEKTFKQNLNYFEQLEELLAEKTKHLKNEILVKDGNQIYISFNDIEKLKPQHLLLYELLRNYGFNSSQVNSVLNAIGGLSGKQFFTESHILTVDREKIIISEITTETDEEVCFLPESKEVYLSKYKLIITKSNSLPSILKTEKNILYVDDSLLVYPLKLRFWKNADTFKPFGMKGFKKLSDYFIQQKISQQQKQNIPILVNGNQEIIWVCGYRSDDRYKVNLNTKKIAIFELFKS